MNKAVLSLFLALFVAQSGCSKFMGGLRRDLDDSDPYSAPTVGGSWSDHGFMGSDLSEGGPFSDRYSAVGHSERGPASDGATGDPQQGSWISPERADANRRDAYRGVGDGDEDGLTTFSSDPNVAPKTKRLYKNGNRATRDDFVDDTKNEGSLWGSDGQTNYYFTKNKVRSVGDIISVKIEDGLLKDIGSESKRTLSAPERERELALANERLMAKFLGGGKKDSDSVASSAAAPDRAPASDGAAVAQNPNNPNAEPPQATYNDIDTLKSMEIKAGDLMMAEILERYPNGNYKIRASKKVPYKNGGPRELMLTGIVRGTDIGEDDVINSGKLYEYRLEALR